MSYEWLSVTLTKKDIRDKESVQAFKTLAALKFPGLFNAADEVHDCVDMSALKGVNLQIPDGYATETDDDALIIQGGQDSNLQSRCSNYQGRLNVMSISSTGTMTTIRMRRSRQRVVH